MLPKPFLLKPFEFLVGHSVVSVSHLHLPAVQGVSLHREALADAAAQQCKPCLGSAGWSHPPQRQQGNVAAGNSGTSYSSSFFMQGKTFSHHIKKGGEAGGELAALQRGRKFSSLCCPWLSWRWAVPQQPDFTWMKKEEYYLLLTPQTGLWEEGFYFCLLTHPYEAPLLIFLCSRHCLILNDRLLCLIWNFVCTLLTLDVMNVNILTLSPQLISKGWNSSAEARFSLRYPPNYKKIHKCSVFRRFIVKQNISLLSLPSTRHIFTFSEILTALAVFYKESKGFQVELFFVWW